MPGFNGRRSAVLGSRTRLVAAARRQTRNDRLAQVRGLSWIDSVARGTRKADLIRFINIVLARHQDPARCLIPNPRDEGDSRHQPICLAPSAPKRARARVFSCHSATAPPWPCIWPRSRRPWRKTPMPSCSWIRPAGIVRLSSRCLTTSPSSCPSRSPELNPVENVWQFMRDNWLSNRNLHIL
jgi:hypothetical protein